MASRRKEKQKRQLAKRQAEERQAIHFKEFLKVPRIVCTGCKEAGRDAGDAFHIIDCPGDCNPAGCAGNHLLPVCARCGEPHLILAAEEAANMEDPQICFLCFRLFDYSIGASLRTEIGAPAGVEEVYYCPPCAPHAIRQVQEVLDLAGK